MKNLLIIKDLAKQRKITLKELAERSGLTEQGMYKIIDSNSTRVDTLESIAKALDVPASFFFDESSETSSAPKASEDEILLNLSRAILSQQETISNLVQRIQKGAVLSDAITADAI